MDYLWLVIGFAILLCSGDFLVKAGVSLSGHFKISPLIAGITIVALGTSAPEFFVSLGAAVKGSSDIAIGNVVGSNIANIALVLGVTAIVLPIPVLKKTMGFDWSIMMFASVLLLLLSLNGSLGFWEGFSLTTILVCYLIILIYKSRKDIKKRKLEPLTPNMSILASFGVLILASIGLYIGAGLLVESAKNIAVYFGVSERIIAITIVALGTSLPELATSVIAACKKQMDISVGNIIGSNIFNILGVIGLTSIIKNISVDKSILEFDIFVMVAISLLLFVLVKLHKKNLLQRWKGGLLLLVYVGYIAFVFLFR